MEFILLMHDDAQKSVNDGAWPEYLADLASKGVLRGGSAMGDGACFRKDDAPTPAITALAGFVKIEASDLEHARSLLRGNPVFEAGGTVEIRVLPRDN